MSSRRSLSVAVSLVAAAALVLSGCSSNKESGGGSTGTGAADIFKSVKVDSAMAALVPSSMKSAGTLTVGTDPSYAPNEIKDSNGNIVGFDIDLFNAVAAKLGLKTKYVQSVFDNILPGLTGGKYDIGVSSFTDNKTREKTVDFVTYYTAGIQWAAPKGKAVDPNNACGLKVSVQTGTTEEDDLHMKSSQCTSAGKKAIQILKFDLQSEATSNLVLGRVDAMSADYPVTVDAVNHNSSKIQLVGQTNYGAAPYGYAVAKTSGTFKQALQKAVQALIDDGTYDKICKAWGLQGGEIKTAQINGATS
ncbi:MAG TPA: ABC transporter substrate-binding protein [Jatrophihabitans sp.]|nr:ABC transporter substrate-binding protein [Jatrophihabitans sp.]